MIRISGPCFTAELPFAWQANQADSLHSDWEVLRYLMVLADFEQGCEAVELAQAKQDLLLLWLAKSQTIHLPCSQLICVGMNQIAWQSSEELSVGTPGMIFLSFSVDFPLLLNLKAQISKVELIKDGLWQLTADLYELSHQVQDQFEQTVFRYHRRAIQQFRQAAA